MITLAQAQLTALAEVSALLDSHGIAHWLFGGWAVDFWVGALTREHGDLDLAVWQADRAGVDALLRAAGWQTAPVDDDSIGAGYLREGVLLELTFVVPGDAGAVCLPFADGHAVWSATPFGDQRRRLLGVTGPVIPLALLRAGKAEPREDPDDAAKDRADFASLTSREASAAEDEASAAEDTADA